MPAPRHPWLPLAILATLSTPAVAQEKEPPPIKVRDEKPFVPYDHLLSTDKVIEQQLDRLKKDPKDVAGYTTLAHLYMRQARDTGDATGYDRADEAIRKALDLKKDDLPAQASLSVVLCARHRFAEGLKLAEDLYRKHPDRHELLSIVGDAKLELGDLDAAEKAYKEFAKKEPRAFVTSRLARVAELRGQVEEALKLMKSAVEEESHTSMTREGRAWYPFRVGEMHFNAGRLDEAAASLDEALKFNPSYPLAQAWLGKVRAGQGKYDEAIKLYVRAIAHNAELFMLADLGDLYTKTGKDFLAKLNYDKIEQAGKKQDVYARELSLFYSDHDRNLPDALELAKKDLAVRKDLYAHDTLAWALCKNKQFKEAAEAIREALKMGTKDAAVLYHAGMIHVGLGEKDRARDFLKRALERNPHFSLLQSEKARQALKDLGD